MTKKHLPFAILILCGFALTQLYQNCAPLIDGGFTVNEMSSMNPDAVDSAGVHPIDAGSTVSVRKQHVVSRDYVASLFREIFTSTKYPISNLETLIDKWVMYKGAQYGGSCNFYSDYSTKDCNGSTSNANLPYFNEDNTVRESFRLQMCDNVLGVDAGVSGALEKLGFTVDTPINQTSLATAYGLFYRSNPPEAAVVATLVDLDNALNASKATLKERWRAALTQICESPGWQLF